MSMGKCVKDFEYCYPFFIFLVMSLKPRIFCIGQES